MQDKKEKPIKSSVSRLVPFEFSEAEMQINYPNVKGEYYGFAIIRDMKEAVAYLAAEVVFEDSVSLHIWIPEEKRSKDNILWLKDVLHTDVTDWAKSIGKTKLMATCPFGLHKTRDLLDTFGFKLGAIWVGVIDTEV